MKNYINFTVVGKPFGQKRPRAFTRGKFVRIYSPNENVAYAKKVVSAYLEAVKKLENRKEYQRTINDKKPLVVEVQAFFKKPKLTKKQQALNLIEDQFPCKKPDGDNILKAICDSLNGVAYHDDSYVVSMNVDKFYTDATERVEVVIYEKE